MACSVGPKVANDGLVFYMDSSNTRRSWRGKPTVNLIGSNFFDGTIVIADEFQNCKVSNALLLLTRFCTGSKI